MELLLMRHAKSDWNTGEQSDFDRPLNDRGRRTAPKVAAWLAAQPFAPTRLVSSPARRARETALVVAEATGIGEDTIRWEEAVYGASVTALLYVLESQASDGEVLLLVGHNPGLEELLVYLTGGRLPSERGAKLMPTAAVAHLRVGEEGRWGPGCAECTLIRTPKQLRAKD